MLTKTIKIILNHFQILIKESTLQQYILSINVAHKNVVHRINSAQHKHRCNKFVLCSRILFFSSNIN